jgi:hypothetical protein
VPQAHDECHAEAGIGFAQRGDAQGGQAGHVAGAGDGVRWQWARAVGAGVDSHAAVEGGDGEWGGGGEEEKEESSFSEEKEAKRLLLIESGVCHNTHLKY